MKKLILLLSAISGYTAHAQSSSWSITGNLITSASTNFIGTLNKESLVFRVNNIEQMRINQIGRITFQGLNSAGEVSSRNLLLGGGASTPTGYGNTVFGLGSLTLNAGGRSNTAIGNNVLAANTSGDANTGLGIYALRQPESAAFNTGLGAYTLQGPGTLEANTAVGYGALARDAAASSDYVGYNTAIGTGAMPRLRTGNANAALGYQAFNALETGENNIAIGTNAGNNVTEGINNIFIGMETPAFSNAPKDELNIGNWIFGVNGTIGIGKFNNPLPYDGIAPDGEKYKLFVKDGIRTEKIKVDIASDNGWADYVFDKDYELRPLKDVESFIQQNGHLPEVPTTEQAIKNGVELKAMNILLLKKIEELTLYSIEQHKRIEVLEKQMNANK